MPPAPKSLAATLAKKGAKSQKEPVWKGPLEDGITQSLLSDFLVCRERFRLKVIEGLAPHPAFVVRMEYGNMWHACEEAHAQGEDWRETLLSYCRKLISRFPMDQESISKWFRVCQIQFNIFLEYWAQHPDELGGETVEAEVCFRVPYQLPSGEWVTLRGKRDKVKLVKKGENRGLWLQENKTHGELDRNEIQRRLTFDQQTMLYLSGMLEDKNLRKVLKEYPLRGVVYNVVRRPLAGGKGTIKQHQPSKSKPMGESEEDFYYRLEHEVIRKMIAEETAEEPAFFARWNVHVSADDVDKMRRIYFNPILQQLNDWYTWVSSPEGLRDPFGGGQAVHWQTPYGFYNVLAEGGWGDTDEFLISGNMSGLSKVTNLFPELEEGS